MRVRFLREKTRICTTTSFYSKFYHKGRVVLREFRDFFKNKRSFKFLRYVEFVFEARLNKLTKQLSMIWMHSEEKVII